MCQREREREREGEREYAYDLEIIVKRLKTTYKEWDLTFNFNNTEFMAINTDQIFHINIEENVRIKQIQNFECLSAILYKKV